MPKRMFICGLMAVAMIGVVDHARAQTAPYQAVATIAAAGTAVNWDAPAATYGPLLSLQSYGLTNAATLAVYHIIPVSSTVNITNTVETAATGGSLLVYPQGYIAPQSVCTNTTLGVVLTTTPVKPVYLNPGDKLRFVASAATGPVAAKIVIRAGFPGQ